MANRIQSLGIVLTILLVSTISSVYAAEEQENLNQQTKLIRIKKIANEWQGTLLTLHGSEGEEIYGRLIEVKAGHFHIETGNTVREIPIESVVMVSFKPGFPELTLTIVSGLMGAGFLSGAMALAKSDASPDQVGVAALLGLLGGGIWGYTTFYESEVIRLE